jgi:hypothetical protein
LPGIARPPQASPPPASPAVSPIAAPPHGHPVVVSPLAPPSSADGASSVGVAGRRRWHYDPRRGSASERSPQPLLHTGSNPAEAIDHRQRLLRLASADYVLLRGGGAVVGTTRACGVMTGMDRPNRPYVVDISSMCVDIAVAIFRPRCDCVLPGHAHFVSAFLTHLICTRSTRYTVDLAQRPFLVGKFGRTAPGQPHSLERQLDHSGSSGHVIDAVRQACAYSRQVEASQRRVNLLTVQLEETDRRHRSDTAVFVMRRRALRSVSLLACCQWL